MTPSAIDILSMLNHRHVANSLSTNSELIEAIKSGTLDAKGRHLLTTDQQSKGRGQRGRSWQSPQGNVYLSLYHPLDCSISGLLSLLVGMALAKMPIIQAFNEQLRTQGLTSIGVKWANDLGFYSPDNTKPSAVVPFHKLAGILIEPVWQAGTLIGVVIGVGLNVQTTPTLTHQASEGLSYEAISLQDIYSELPKNALDERTKALPSLRELYQQMSRAVLTAVACFKDMVQADSHTQEHLTRDFLQQFACVDALAGLRLRVTQESDTQCHLIEGDACGIDTQGCLQLRQDDGKICALFTGRIEVINGLLVSNK